jgi:hypothetical protein
MRAGTFRASFRIGIKRETLDGEDGDASLGDQMVAALSSVSSSARRDGRRMASSNVVMTIERS